MYREQCFDLSREEIKAARRQDPRQTGREELLEVLTRLGVRPGMQIVVHSSLASLGEFEGGAENVCRTLMDLVTEEGTLLMPALVQYPASGADYCYRVQETPAGVGKIPETFRQMPGVVRSWDPTHSFCAWGRDKDFFVREHHKTGSMHDESPLGRLEKAGGWCLMLGCKQTVTFMHVVETTCQAPCLGTRTEVYPAILPDGRRVTLRGWGWRDKPCRADDFDAIYRYMQEKDILAEAMLGIAHLRFFKLSHFREAYRMRLLDPESGCAGCPARPRVVQQSTASDWDPVRGAVSPDSDAFTGEWQAAAECR